jgi:magnesium-transporting ATPase (P-type)
VVEKNEGVITYNASSPDELALTNAARYFGFVFEERDHNSNIVIWNKKTDVRTKYELLNILEFSSARKRMSVIVRTPEDKIMIMTKGADSVIVKRLHPGQEEVVYITMKNIDVFANEGLRTLLIAEKEIDPQAYF